ncbi:hypothetical protein JKF63_07621 [Porcisia hertigi]|uniref:Chromatin assembly factor 1 subunit A dimerization domain-containing protein n=1 Tax=Porcisia hertigi TaxID=2761500 RepID=A0A836LJ25_9TRYP|nr:hypothetical protein JKF63_07621 [Porcisia hertigi]
MDNVTELLKGLDPSRIDEALALLQSIKNNAAPQELGSKPVSSSGKSEAGPISSEPKPLQRAENVGCATPVPAELSAERASGMEVGEEDVPLASLGHVLSPEEKRKALGARKAQREAEKEARRRIKEEHATLIRSEMDGRKVVIDDEKESRRVLKDTERETRKAEREARRKAREEEQEAEREARHKAREAEKEALKIPKEAPNSLSLFGFMSSTVKVESDKKKLFTSFVQNKRVAPASLQFWLKPEDRVSRDEEASIVNLSSRATHHGARRDPEARRRNHIVDEESSLLHPPMCFHPDASTTVNVCVRDFSAMIEASNTQEVPARHLLRQCGCAFHAAVSDPYASFDNEVVFAGFFAIGYDPCQSRPPYFGTYNHLQEGSLNEAELLHMGRFPLRTGIPRLSNIDYEYDSGDDWDVMDGDEDIAASSSGDSDKDADMDSLDSSDLDFIDDEDDDSDCDIQRKVIEARQRRLHRLRSKDKLVPSYSGPFVGIPTDEHPLRGFDKLERFAPLSVTDFAKLLENQLHAFTSGCASIPGADDEGLSAEEVEAKRQRVLMEAALRNRREMTDTELKALQTIIAANSKVSTKMILAAFKEQQLCVGVARAEIERTIKRFYERRHRSLILRAEPWLPTDERLYARVSASKKPKLLREGSARGSTGDGAGRDDDNDEDADDDDDADDILEGPVDHITETTGDASARESHVGGESALGLAAPSETLEEAGHPTSSSRSSGEAKAEATVPKTKQMTLAALLAKENASTPIKSGKRTREDEQTEDQNGGVTSEDS